MPCNYAGNALLGLSVATPSENSFKIQLFIQNIYVHTLTPFWLIFYDAQLNFVLSKADLKTDIFLIWTWGRLGRSLSDWGLGLAVHTCLLWHKVGEYLTKKIWIYSQQTNIHFGSIILSTYHCYHHCKRTAFLCTLPSSCILQSCGTPSVPSCIFPLCRNTFLGYSWPQKSYSIMTK